MNTAQAMPWWGWLFFAGFFLLLGLTGVMFVSILRQGDERRRLILLHAGSTSFSAFVGMLLLAIQGISEILKHVDWVIEYIRNGCKDPQIDEGPSAAEAVILENGGHIPVDEKGEK